MSRILELFEDWNNIAAVNRSQLCRSDDATAGLIIVFEVDDFQIFADGFKHQKFVFKLGHCNIDQLSQFDTAGMPTFDYGGSTERKIAADRHADTSRQSNCETFVVAVPQTDTP